MDISHTISNTHAKYISWLCFNKCNIIRLNHDILTYFIIKKHVPYCNTITMPKCLWLLAIIFFSQINDMVVMILPQYLRAYWLNIKLAEMNTPNNYFKTLRNNYFIKTMHMYLFLLKPGLCSDIDKDLFIILCDFESDVTININTCPLNFWRV